MKVIEPGHIYEVEQLDLERIAGDPGDWERNNAKWREEGIAVTSRSPEPAITLDTDAVLHAHTEICELFARNSGNYDPTPQEVDAVQDGLTEILGRVVQAALSSTPSASVPQLTPAMIVAGTNVEPPCGAGEFIERFRAAMAAADSCVETTKENRRAASTQSPEPAITLLRKVITDAQDILAAYIVPSGISDHECINRLLGLLDGPQSREALRGGRQSSPEPANTQPLRLIFVNREVVSTPERPVHGPHPGSQTQEYIRVLVDCLEVLIDRTNHCDSCLRWEGNDRIIKNFSEAQRQLRLALLHHEARALERKVDKDGLEPEKIPTQKDGHFGIAYDPTSGGPYRYNKS